MENNTNKNDKMNSKNQSEIPKWIQNKIINFFNSARSVSMILNGTIQDDPSDGAGTSMGSTLAARILRERKTLPRQRFTDFQQIENIRGIGKGTLKDLVFSFSTHADKTFRQSMYETETIYEENWTLDYFRFGIENEDFFNAITNDEEKLRQFIIEKIKEVCLEKKVAAASLTAMITDLNQSYIDHYYSQYPAAIALALWFFMFDQDNWFSWERIQKQTFSYIDDMDLYLFRGFQDRGILGGINPGDLPVIVNHSEQAITFWASALYD